MRRLYSRSLLLVLVLSLSVKVVSTAPVTPSYVGSSKCRVCHLQQYKSWQQTKMAQAYELLKPGKAAEVKRKAKLDPNKDYERDSSCLVCHTTGYGKPGGFQSIETTPDLAGVGCEACHGPGLNYLQATLMSLQNKEYKRADLLAAGLILPNKQTCVGCHNHKSPFVQPGSPFNFEQMKNRGTHEQLPLKYPH